MTKTATIIETNRTNREVISQDAIKGRGVKHVAGNTYLITDAAYQALKADGWTFVQDETASWH